MELLERRVDGRSLVPRGDHRNKDPFKCWVEEYCLESLFIAPRRGVCNAVGNHSINDVKKDVMSNVWFYREMAIEGDFCIILDLKSV